MARQLSGTNTVGMARAAVGTKLTVKDCRPSQAAGDAKPAATDLLGGALKRGITILRQLPAVDGRAETQPASAREAQPHHLAPLCPHSFLWS